MTFPLRPGRRAVLTLEALEGRTCPSFLAPTDLHVGEGPHDVAVADFNRDGALDLVTTNRFGSETGVVLLFGNGDGTFRPPATLAPSRHLAVVSDDFNGDGLPDLALTYLKGGGWIPYVLPGNGDGSFGKPLLIPTDGSGATLTAADLDGDRVPDLVNGDRILLGNGDGTFRFVGWIDGTGLHVAVADFNGDGRADLATPISDAGILLVYPGNGDGTFRSPLSFSAPIGGLDAVAAGDFNGDGRTDLALTGTARVRALFGNGAGAFPTQRDLPVPGSYYTTSLAAADLDGNGALDLVAAGSVLLNNGDGTFRGAQEYFVGSFTVNVAVGDWNRDGALDFVTTNYGGATLNVRLNNGDGTFGRAPRYGRPDVLYWSVAAADLDGDGAVDLATTGGILLGNGDGSFRDPVPFSVPDFPLAVAVLDGGSRLAVGTSGRVHILENAGGGAFRPLASYPLARGIGDNLMRMAVADLNGDGLADLVATDVGGVNALLGNADGTFRRTATPRTVFDASSVTVADFNGDGRADLAVGHGGFASAGYERIDVLLGNGDGTFQDSVEHRVGINPLALVAADFNGDGAADLAVLDQWGGRLYVLSGRGDGTFENGPPLRITGGTDAFALVLGDFNHDGVWDLAATGDNGVGVLIGRGDGTFAAPLHYGATGFPLGLAAADFNGDGFTDLAVAGEHGGIAVLLNAADW